jgi:hypothetical protein
LALENSSEGSSSDNSDYNDAPYLFNYNTNDQDTSESNYYGSNVDFSATQNSSMIEESGFDNSQNMTSLEKDLLNKSILLTRVQRNQLKLWFVIGAFISIFLVMTIYISKLFINEHIFSHINLVVYLSKNNSKHQSLIHTPKSLEHIQNTLKFQTTNSGAKIILFNDGNNNKASIVFSTEVGYFNELPSNLNQGVSNLVAQSILKSS